MTRILKILENSDKYSSAWWFKVFIPVLFLMEYYNQKYWWKVIINELLTKDEIVNWLDKQEFALEGRKLWKMDLINHGSFYEVMDLTRAKEKIRGEFIESLGELLDNNCETDIENLFNLEIEFVNRPDTNAKCYKVTICYWRNSIYMERKKIFKLISLLLGLGLITASLLFSLMYVLGI